MAATEKFGLVRVDDRLIHGQVIAVWCKHQRFDRIVIVDDDVAADPFMQEVLGLAAPPDLQVEVLAVAEAIQALGPGTPSPETTMVLLKTPQVAKRLYDGGLRFDALNVGGIGSAPGRRSVFKNISMSDEEVAVLAALQDSGVDITLLTVPGEKSKRFSDLVNEL